MKVAVVGAGLAGLTAAHRLRRDGHEPTLLEAAEEVGGVVRSRRDGGFLAEEGPHTMTPLPGEIDGLLEEVGLAGRRQEPPERAKRRYVVKDGRAVAMPGSPGQLLGTGLLSWRSKAALLAEAARPAADVDGVTVAELFRRRGLGADVLDRFVEPFVGGVFAGDPEELSAEHALPRLWRTARDHGSLVRGMIARARSGNGGRPKLFSFRGGMADLPRALARPLEGRIRIGCRVASVEPTASGWRVRPERGPAEPYDGVVLAVPAHALGDLELPGVRGPDLDRIGAIPHPPISVVTMGYRRAQVEHSLDGFGVLVPGVEGLDTLGVLFSSSMFPGRAPEGHVTLSCFLGGRRAPESARGGEEAVTRRATRDLRRLLGVEGTPVWTHHRHWRRSIPQYTRRHERVRESLRRAERRSPGLAFAGSFEDGVSVGATMASGWRAAGRLPVDRGNGGGPP